MALEFFKNKYLQCNQSIDYDNGLRTSTQRSPASIFEEFRGHLVYPRIPLSILEEFTYCAIKALTMIIVVKSLYPTVTSFDRKATGDTFGCEQFIPI